MNGMQQVNYSTLPPFAGKLFLWLLEKEESPVGARPGGKQRPTLYSFYMKSTIYGIR